MIRYVEMEIAKLKPDPENPRTISDKARAALAYSLKKFGLVQPIVVNETTGHVVGGHQRLNALRDLGEARAMVAIGQWTLAEERALNVTLNNPAAQGKFTHPDDYLGESLDGLTLTDFKELRLDVFDTADAGPVSVVESGLVDDEFWISVRGRLKDQASALKTLTDALGKIPDLTVEIGSIKR